LLQQGLPLLGRQVLEHAELVGGGGLSLSVGNRGEGGGYCQE
jgi:hypothetical protein